jgi:hypothetical protein
VFIIVFYLIEEQPILPCQVGLIVSSYRNHQIVNLSYLIFLGCLSALMAVAVLVLSVLLLRILVSDTSNNVAIKELTTMTALIVATFPLMFLVRTALLIAAALDSNVVIPVMVFTLLELFPSAVLLYYIYPWASAAVRGAGERGSDTITKSTNAKTTTKGTRKGAVSTNSSSGSNDPRASINRVPSKKAMEVRKLIYKDGQVPDHLKEPKKAMSQADKVRALYKSKTQKKTVEAELEQKIPETEPKDVKAVSSSPLTGDGEKKKKSETPKKKVASESSEDKSVSSKDDSSDDKTSDDKSSDDKSSDDQSSDDKSSDDESLSSKDESSDASGTGTGSETGTGTRDSGSTSVASSSSSS